MAPLVLEGETLGQKHRYYNSLIQAAVTTNDPNELKQIDYEDPDIDNLHKIDIACRRKYVEYILEVLKSQDMLYVSRALKRSEWLITEEQYNNIINAGYLHGELFPQMTAKAKNKFMLQIRLKLKDEKRVEDFFDHIKEHDLKSALKWLPNCSVAFTEKIIKEHANLISVSQIKRLCEKSASFLTVYCENTFNYNKAAALEATIFLIQNSTEKYLDTLEACSESDTPTFGPKYTKFLMNKCPKRILDNFERYAHCIDLQTYAYILKKEEIKEFILKTRKNKKLRSLINYNNVGHFLKRLPKGERFEFVKQVFIDKTMDVKDNPDDEAYEGRTVCYKAFQSSMACRGPTYSNIYRWYKYAPFTVALADLKKLIRNESNPNERIAMLGIILKCAGNNLQNIQTLLKFYRDYHINEPFKFKVQFVNNVINRTDIHKYDSTTWGYLNDIFTSLEVYEISSNNVHLCVKSVILYNVIHSKPIPKVVEDKFDFDSFKSSQKKLSASEKEKLFNYLYAYLLNKLGMCITINERDFAEAVEILKQCLCLVKDWKKNLSDKPQLLEKIREFIQIKKNNSWKTDLSHLYTINKTWRRLLFKESILLNPSQKTCLNALKHQPTLLDLYKSEVECLCLKENELIKKLLKKIRIYWPHTFGNDIKSIYFEKLDENNYHKTIIFGLCLLLPMKELLELINKNAPHNYKIDWSEQDNKQLSLQKQIAKQLHLARPQPSLSTVLLYAKGDYLQFALPSLSAILYNMNCIQVRAEINHILNAPVSLQKHGLRIVLTKLKNEDIKEIFKNIWASTKNSTIRAVIFKQTYKMLSKEKNPNAATEIWELLSMFIDNLTTDENKIIYVTMSNAQEIPFPVRVEYWIKSYKFLKSLPEKANCTHLFSNLKRTITEISEFLDVNVAKEIFIESFNKEYDNNTYSDAYNLVVYLYSSKDEVTQNIRYKNIFVPILEKAFASWNEQVKNLYCTRAKIREICKYLSTEFYTYVLNNNMVMPISLLHDILNKLETQLPKHENYMLLTSLKLTLTYMTVLDKIIKHEENDVGIKAIVTKYKNKWSSLYSQAMPEFAKICTQYLKDDVKESFSCIYHLFSDALSTVFNNFWEGNMDILKTLKVFADCEDCLEAQLLVFKLLPNYLYEEEEKTLKIEILKTLSLSPSKMIQYHYWNYQESSY